MALFGNTVVLPTVIQGETIAIVQREVNHVGSKYTGEISINTGKRHGHGSYIYKNPYFQFEGQWADGEKHGQGKLMFGDGGFYEGSFLKGEIIGQGTRQWADGSNYVGEFDHGDRQGTGTFTSPDGTTYEGSWSRNQYSGEGELTLPSGDHYVGSFQKHLFNGQGTLECPSQDTIYKGSFEEGKYEGEGELTNMRFQFTYTGQFRSGHMDGFGKGVDQRSGLSHEGEWADDKPARNPARFDVCATGDGPSYLPQEVPEGDTPPAPEAELTVPAGGELPQVIIKVLDTRDEQLSAETGRQLKFTMYIEKEVIVEEETQTEKCYVLWGDCRVPPEPNSQAGTPEPGQSNEPVVPEELQQEGEEPFLGDDVVYGRIEEAGEMCFGGSETWLVPAYVEPGKYNLVIEDVTDITQDYLWEKMAKVAFTVTVTPREEEPVA